MKKHSLTKFFSQSKKPLIAVVVVGVLLVAALMVNNTVQATPNLQASAGTSGFLIRIIANILPNRLDPLRRIPNDTETFANTSASDNAIFQDDNGEIVFNLDNIEGIQSLAIRGGNSAGAILPEENTLFTPDSYIVTFRAEPLAEKTKQLVEARGGEILPGDRNREALRQDIRQVKTQIDNHKALITTQQNGLMTKLSSELGSPTSSTAAVKVYEEDGKEIKVRQLKSALNAVTISNVSEEQLQSIVEGVSNIERIERARPVQVNLTEAAEMVNALSIQEFLGANGVPLTGQGTTIAIVDTGVDYMHQDLGACSFLLESGCKVAYGYDFVNNDPDPMDDHGHGTHVAATAAGNGYYTQSNGTTQPLLGIAPDATIYAYKVLSATGSGTNLSVIAGIEACVDPNGDGDISDRVTVCSLSLGSSNGSPLDPDALAADAAVDAGVIMTIAAGNAGPGSETIGSPGTSRKSITVGAACKTGDIGNASQCSQAVASFSSRGPVLFTDENGQSQTLNKPDIVAPGVNICAAQWGDWMQGNSCLGDNEHIAISGTSMATPVVAGVMALLAQAHPDKTVAELKEALMSSSTDLGLPVTIQGQGLINANAALESIGIPNAIVAIEGLPFYVSDTETTQISTYEKELILENITNQSLNLTATRITNTPGVTMTFPSTLTIPAGATFDFNVAVTINHTQASSGRNLKETIRLSNGSEQVNITVLRNTPEYLIPAERELSFGLFHESQATFNATLPLEVTNRMSEQTGIYSVQIDESLIASSSRDNIQVTPSTSQITLGPNQSTTVNFTVSAFSQTGNILPNREYKIIANLVSPTETIPIEFSFFRGYAFELEYGEEEPDFITVAGSSWQMSFYPNPQEDSMLLRATQPGPYHVVAVYNDRQNSFDLATLIFEHDISLTASQGILSYDISKDRAEHRIENNYFGNTCFARFASETGTLGKGLSVVAGGKRAFEYNTLSPDMEFSLMCGDLMPDNTRILFSQIYLTEGLNQDFSLNDDTADISTRFIYGFNNQETEERLSLGIHMCNFRTFKNNGSVNSSNNYCSFWKNEGGKRLTIDEGESAVVEVRSLHTATPETASVPSYPSFRIFSITGDGSSSDSHMYTTPEMFATSDKLYAWAPGLTGILTTTQSPQTFYERFKVPVVNDQFITIGAGPVVDTTFVRSFRDIFGFLASYDASYLSLYRFADGSTESFMGGNPQPTRALIQFFRDNNLVATVNPRLDDTITQSLIGSAIPDEQGDRSGNLYGGPAIGSYRVAIDRQAVFNGENQDGFFSSEIEFNISNSVVDSVPPVIRTIQLVNNGILQNHFDPEQPGELRLYVEPGLGIQSHNNTPDVNDAYQIQLLPDSISSISVLAGDSFESLAPLPTPQFTGQYYSLDLTSLSGASAPYKYFRVIAEDSAGNSITYNFGIEIGQSLNVEDLADQFLLICVQNPPLVQFLQQPPVISNPNAFVPVQLTITNQDTAACAPRIYHFRLRTTLFPPLNSIVSGSPKIRGVATGITPPAPTAQTTSGMFGSTNLLNPGQVRTHTIWMRPDAALPSGQYQIGLHWLATQNSSSQILGDYSFPVQVGNVTPPPPTCTPANTTVSFSPATPGIDSGGPTTAFNFTVTNTDSAGCSPSNFSLAFDTDQFASFENGTREIRGSASNSNSFTTTEFSIATGLVNPGQSVTRTGYLRTDLYFPNGSYQIGAVLTDTTNNQTQTVPFTVNVTGAESVPVCTANTTSVVFNPDIPNIDSGNAPTVFQFTITNNDTEPCSPSNFSLAFDTDQFANSVVNGRRIRGSVVQSSDFVGTEFSASSGTLNPGQSFTGTGYLRTDLYFPNGSYQIGAVLTDTTNNQTQTVPFTVNVTGAESVPVGSCVRNPASVTPIGLIATHPNTDTTTRAYQISITNNDTSGCPNSTFRVIITDPLEGFGIGKSNLVRPEHNAFNHSWNLAPGQTQTRNVFYRNFGSVSNQIVPLNIEVSDITATTQGSTHPTVILQGSIQYGTP